MIMNLGPGVHLPELYILSPTREAPPYYHLFPQTSSLCPPPSTKHTKRLFSRRSLQPWIYVHRPSSPAAPHPVTRVFSGKATRRARVSRRRRSRSSAPSGVMHAAHASHEDSTRDATAAVFRPCRPASEITRETPAAARSEGVWLPGAVTAVAGRDADACARHGGREIDAACRRPRASAPRQWPRAARTQAARARALGTGGRRGRAPRRDASG
jgi:hypothetical protein